MIPLFPLFSSLPPHQFSNYSTVTNWPHDSPWRPLYFIPILPWELILLSTIIMIINHTKLSELGNLSEKVELKNITFKA